MKQYAHPFTHPLPTPSPTLLAIHPFCNPPLHSHSERELKPMVKSFVEHKKYTNMKKKMPFFLLYFNHFFYILLLRNFSILVLYACFDLLLLSSSPLTQL
jgi:hypothetical protein